MYKNSLVTAVGLQAIKKIFNTRLVENNNKLNGAHFPLITRPPLNFVDVVNRHTPQVHSS